MEISTYGNRNNENILLFHPMFTSAEFFNSFVEKLQDEFFFIVPTLSGHSHGSTYVSVEEEERQLDQFLQSNGIDKIKLVIGFSLGGNIAFDYFSKNSSKTEKVVVDSAPLFNFPRFVKRHFLSKYKKCLQKVRQNPTKAADELNKNFHGMGNAQKEVAQIVTDESLTGLIESCYNVDLPRLTETEQSKITFLYGTKDIAKLCLPRIRRYKHSSFVKLSGLNHCEYFMEHQDEYIQKFVR